MQLWMRVKKLSLHISNSFSLRNSREFFNIRKCVLANRGKITDILFGVALPDFCIQVGKMNVTLRW
jgi:hypothetical protein